MPSAAKSTLGQELMEDVRPDKTRTLVQKAEERTLVQKAEERMLIQSGDTQWTLVQPGRSGRSSSQAGRSSSEESRGRSSRAELDVRPASRVDARPGAKRTFVLRGRSSKI
ncbi:hypothetical protein LR48_Vigan11g025100 [Vigna angularis]|uniref:Uncharacterized protein n=1 Tax=Phaseolus angularis TaxID=3914 RepID=A0A0L9VR37_PHAAN|nr:hypothetical protein LR48_Vigan11g025100 [Vigna angularis]